MVIKVLGTGCEKCDKLYQNVQQAVKELGIDAEIQKIEDLMELVQLGVMSSPSMMIDDKLVLRGQTANVKTISKLIVSKENL